MGDENGFEDLNMSHICASWAPGVGFAGITAAVVFASKLRFLWRFWTLTVYVVALEHHRSLLLVVRALEICG